jgi:hypothetical protein
MDRDGLRADAAFSMAMPAEPTINEEGAIDLASGEVKEQGTLWRAQNLGRNGLVVDAKKKQSIPWSGKRSVVVYLRQCPILNSQAPSWQARVPAFPDQERMP